jgi:large subunit ribosomal protein L22
MNVRASAKMVGTSNRKIGLVAALIRGRKAQDAVTMLRQTPQRASGPLGKVLHSAIANAENNYNLSARDLKVESVVVGPGPTLKRFRPRAKGRAFPIGKRTSHITVVLADGKAAAKASSAAAATAELASGSNSPRSRAVMVDSTQPAQPTASSDKTSPKEAK